MSERNPSSNLPLFIQTIVEPILARRDRPRVTQYDAAPASAASGLPTAALLALQAALWQTRGTEFCSDHVWRNLSVGMRDVVDTHGNAMGWLFARARKLKQITRTGRTVPSIRPKSRGRQVATWVWL